MGRGGEAVTILLVEDDPDGRRSVAEALDDGGWRVQAVADGRTALSLLGRESYDAVLTDLVLPDVDGFSVMERAKEVDPHLPVVMMTAYGSVDTAVRALKSGAYDYLVKPVDLDELQSKMGRAIEARRLRREVDDLHAVVGERFSIRQMVADSPSMENVIRQVRVVADTNATVLILGESGTGKELVARALHGESRRASGTFVAVNCGAFTETLLESALFGHEKGSFTGASQRRMGAFERADGGTLFLDEIAIAPRSVQARLLRALEEKEILRVGGEDPVRIDARIVAASNRDLEALVEEESFLPDLLFRLRVVTIRLPPLRERKEDIRALVERFVSMACEEHGRRIDRIEPGYYEVMKSQRWPGNIRELRNAVESSVILATGSRLTASDVPIASGLGQERAVGIEFPPGMSLAHIEKEALLQGLRRNRGNRALTADELGVSARTIQRKIKDYDLPF
jgi:two-component system, NtrC family, response regulator AtoC